MDKGNQLAPVANQNVIATVQIKDKSKMQKALKWATGVATAFGVTVTATAADTIDFSAASSQLSSAQTAILGIIATLITIFGIVIAWRTFRRSAG